MFGLFQVSRGIGMTSPALMMHSSTRKVYVSPNRVPKQFSKHFSLSVHIVPRQYVNSSVFTHSSKHFGRRIQTGMHGADQRVQIARLARASHFDLDIPVQESRPRMS